MTSHVMDPEIHAERPDICEILTRIGQTNAFVDDGQTLIIHAAFYEFDELCDEITLLKGANIYESLCEVAEPFLTSLAATCRLISLSPSAASHFIKIGNPKQPNSLMIL